MRTEAYNMTVHFVGGGSTTIYFRTLEDRDAALAQIVAATTPKRVSQMLSFVDVINRIHTVSVNNIAFVVTLPKARFIYIIDKDLLVQHFPGGHDND